MKLMSYKIKQLCKDRGITISELLEQSGVSRTAYYSLLKKESLLPKSILALANTLETKPAELLKENKVRQEEIIDRLQKQFEAIVDKHPETDKDNIWHTLLLLEEKPIERLTRALRRASSINILTS